MTCVAPPTVYVGNTSIVQVLGLMMAGADSFIDDAAVEITAVKDAEGVSVSGQVWPTPMNHIVNGDYEGTLVASLAIVAGHTYTAIVTAQKPPATATWMLAFVPRIRI